MAAPAEELDLFPATPEQYHHSLERQFESWAFGLTFDAFVKKEVGLKDGTELGKALRCWVLAPKSSPTTLDFYCAVETYRRPVVLHLPSSTPPPEASTPALPATTTTIGYSIASVFTPPKHRRKGYAAKMMTILHDKLALPEGAALVPYEEGEASGYGEDGVCSFLYSDVGDFYSRCFWERSGAGGKEKVGWRVVSPLETTWLVSSLPASPAPSPDVLKPITTSDFPSLTHTDSLSPLPSTPSSPTPAHSSSGWWYASPTFPTLEWQVTRATLSATSKGATLPPCWGFEYGRRGSDEWSFLTFTMDPPSALRVLRFRLGTPTTTLVVNPEQVKLEHTREGIAHALVDAALVVAKGLGFDKVVGWNVAAGLGLEVGEDGKVLRGQTIKREEHLDAVTWYGPKASGKDGEEPEWRLNEGYAWC
ncbi:hypothetical protein MNV49_003263 [Pseudohyphozyma bogoriensis]|nr:hypothetical protein MNV49_003263 [Pseudohyphozyma bogoriensis]